MPVLRGGDLNTRDGDGGGDGDGPGKRDNTSRRT